ncbi:indolepyruvate oxidoreductase, partial [Adlercreutzia equolifaciens]|nr:indolepyruvate oxidoreductase [Adlercreutzia equolifaciens]
PLRVHGKLTGEANDRGENTTENIAGRLGRFFDRTDRSNGLAALVASTIGANDLSYEGPLPVRPPVLCAGCPHRGSFYAVKQALRGREAVLCGDIGCYT